MKKNNRIILISFTAIIALACACPVSGLIPNEADSTEPTPGLPTFSTVPATQPQQPTTVIPIKPPTSVPANPSKVLYTDDFSTESAEMESYSDENGSVGIKDGAYAVVSLLDLWNWGNSNSEFGDVIIEFDATLVQGPSNDNAGIGVVCKLVGRDDDSVDGYMMAISGDGYYAISVAEAGTLSPLVNWTSSEAINTGKATNHIRATCKGNELSLEVNGQLIASATTTDGNLTSGAIAFAAISYEETEPIAEVHFDNLTVSEP